MIGSLPLKSATVPEYSSLSVIIGKSVSVSNKNNFKKIMCKNTNRQKRLSNCVGDHRDTRLVPIFQSQEYSYLHWFDIHGTLDETSLYRKLKADLAMAWQEFVHNFDTLPVKLISKIRFFIDLSVTSCTHRLQLKFTSSLPLTTHIFTSSSGEYQTNLCCSDRSNILKL